MAQKAFRATVYEVFSDAAEFSGATYTLPLEQDLAENYLVFLRASGASSFSPADDSQAAISADPFGTGDLGTTTNPDEIELSRVGTTGNWGGSVIVLESLGDHAVAGFTLVDVLRVTMTGTADDVATAISGSWTDLDQVTALSMPLGGGVEVTGTATADYQSGWAVCQAQESPTKEVRLRRTGVGGPGLETATFTVYVIEWGSEWTIQKVYAETGSNNGGNGIDVVGEYENFSITSTPAAEAFVLFSAAIRAEGLGEGVEGLACILGDGVTQLTNETTMSLGTEFGGKVMAAEMISIHHPDLVVDRRFGADGTGTGIEDGNTTGTRSVSGPTGPSEIYPLSGTVRATAGYRIPILTNTLDTNGTSYPKNLLRARHTAATTVSWERANGGGDGAYWLQSIDFFGIERTDVIDLTPAPLAVPTTVAVPVVAKVNALTPSALAVASTVAASVVFGALTLTPAALAVPSLTVTPTVVVDTGQVLTPASLAIAVSPQSATVDIDPIRVSQIRLKKGQFTGQTFDVPLLDEAGSPRNLVANYYVRLFAGTNDNAAPAGDETTFADEHLCRVSGDPFGDFDDTTSANVLRLKRGDAAPASDLEVTLTVVECLDPTHARGFTSRGGFQLTMAAASLSASAAHSGVVDSDQCVAILAGLESANATAWQKAGGFARLRHTGTDVEVDRLYDHSSLTVSAFLIEWGSAVTVELVEFDIPSITAGGVLDDTADWHTAAISPVTAENAFISATFATKGSTVPECYAESLAWILGDGVSQIATESKVAVGAYGGGKQVQGWAYVVSCPSWFVSRTIHVHGSLVAAGITSATFAIPAPSSGEEYLTIATDERSIGHRFIEFCSTTQTEFTSGFRFCQSAVVPTSPVLASYERYIADKPDPYGTGLAVSESVDFAGSPFGDPNDISATESTVLIDQNHSHIVTGEHGPTITVTVRDSASKVIPSAAVKLQIGVQTERVSVSDANGIAVFTKPDTGSVVLGAQAVVVKMGASEVVASPGQNVTYEAIPRNYGKVHGINTFTVKDWSEEDPFVDLFLGGRGANMRDRDLNPFHIKAKEDFDANGWQKTCTTAEDCNYVIIKGTKGNRPSGNHICTYTGGGWDPDTTDEIKMVGGTITSNVAGRIEFTWDGEGDLTFQVRPTSANMTAANYVKDVLILHEDDELTYDRGVNVWRQDYLDSFGPTTHLRTMNFSQTNNSAVEEWADRPTPDTSNCGRWLYDTAFPDVQRDIGVPWEWQLDLANRLNADPELNIPHAATFDYVDNFAALVKSDLNPDLVAGFEYSNECWNGIFTQAAYRAGVLFARFGLSGVGNDWNQAYATRAVELFNRIDVVFGTELHRRQRRLGGQASSGNMAKALTEALVDVSPTGISGPSASFADAYTIGLYFGNAVDESTLEAVLEEMLVHLAEVIDPVTGHIATNLAGLADLSLLRLQAYEGGQHLVAGAAHPNMTDDLVRDANRTNAIRDALRTLLIAWTDQNPGEPFNIFGHLQDPSDAGAWGLAETLGDWIDDVSLVTDRNQKLAAWLDWAFSLTQVVAFPVITAISATVQTPTVILGLTITPTPLALVSSSEVPTLVVEDGDLTLSPTPLALAVSSVAPVLSSSLEVDPSALAAQVSSATPTVILGLTITPSALALSSSLPAPQLSVTFGVTPTPLALQAPPTTPTVVLGLTITPSVSQVFASPQTVSISVAAATIIEPSALAIGTVARDAFYAGRVIATPISLRVAESVNLSLRAAQEIRIKLKQ